MGKYSANKLSFYFGFLIIIIFFIIWEISVRYAFIPELVLPMPSKIFSDGIKVLCTNKFVTSVLFTISNWIIGLVLGIILGLGLGFISGINSNIEKAILPISAFFRSIPPIALFPIFLIIIGTGRLPIIIAGILGVVIYVFPLTISSVEQVKDKYKDLSVILGYNKIEFIKKIIIPSTILSSLVSIRIASSYLFAICIGGEIIIGGRNGIGSAIVEYSERYQLEEAYFYIIIIGIMGVIIDLSISSIQKKLKLYQ